jgi:hypothetical protein
MKRAMVQYKVKPGRAEENERYIAAVFAALEKAQPSQLRYTVFKADDGVSFVHLFSHEGPGDRTELRDLPEFEAFLAGIRERCDEPPVTIPLNPIGTYRFLVP